MNALSSLRKRLSAFAKRCSLYFSSLNLVQRKKIFLLLGVMGIILISVLGGIWFKSPSVHAQKAAQEVFLLADKIRDFYRIKPNYWGLDTSFALENNIFPSDMVQDETAQNALGSSVLVGSGFTGEALYPGSQGFDIVYTELGRVPCIFLLSYPFSKEQTLSLSQISLLNDLGDNITFTWGGDFPLMPDAQTAKKFCSKSNSILWHFE